MLLVMFAGILHASRFPEHERVEHRLELCVQKVSARAPKSGCVHGVHTRAPAVCEVLHPDPAKLVAHLTAAFKDYTGWRHLALQRQWYVPHGLP